MMRLYAEEILKVLLSDEEELEILKVVWNKDIANPEKKIEKLMEKEKDV